MTPQDHIDALLSEAGNGPSPRPPADLAARVLADAAVAAPELVKPRTRPGVLARIFAPVGGLGGALALVACAAFGIFAGAGYADELLALPGLDGVLAGLSDNTDSTTPFESLSFLMSEG